jgi:hypothetical protein
MNRIRKTYAVWISVDGSPELRLAGFIRVEGDESAYALPKGGPLVASGRVPNGPSDLIPNDWSEWSDTIQLPGAEDGSITVNIERKKAAVTAFVRPSQDWATLSGYGFIYAAIGGRTVSPRVSVTGNLLSSESISESDPIVVPRAYRLKKVAEGKAQMKCSGLGILPDGKWILCEYDNVNRSTARALVEGQEQFAYESHNTETIDSPSFPASAVSLMKSGQPCGVSASENGAPVRWGLLGTVWHGIPASFNLAFSSQSIYRGESPLYFDAARDARPVIRDASGKAIYTFEAGKGIPYSVAELKPGIYALTLCDNAERGITFSDGRFIPTKTEPRMIILWGGLLLAGVGPDLMEVVEGGSLRPFIATRSFQPSVDDAAIASDGNLWIATGADGIALLSPNRTVVWETSLADSANNAGLFGSRIAHRDGRTLFARNNQNRDNRWELFEVTPA